VQLPKRVAWHLIQEVFDEIATFNERQNQILKTRWRVSSSSVGQSVTPSLLQEALVALVDKHMRALSVENVQLPQIAMKSTSKMFRIFFARREHQAASSSEP
ncbi:hypothetical protein Tcan_00920, partial [Toxocara canis]